MPLRLNPMTSACIHATVSPLENFYVRTERERSLAHPVDELIRHAYALSTPSETDSAQSLKRAAAAAPGPSKARNAVVSQVRLWANCAVVGVRNKQSNSLNAMLAIRGAATL
jgi:hypothetical protein